MTWPAIIILTAACVACAANACTLVKLTLRLNAAERAIRKQLEVTEALYDRLIPAESAFDAFCGAIEHSVDEYILHHTHPTPPDDGSVVDLTSIMQPRDGEGGES